MKTLTTILALLIPFFGLSAPRYVGDFYGDGGGLTNLSGTMTNVSINYLTNNYAYITNLYPTYMSNYNMFLTQTNAYITNLNTTVFNGKTTITTNLYAEYITNNYAYITNLYTSNAYVTNLTIYNTFTNLGLNANQYVISDDNKKLTSTLDGRYWTNLYPSAIASGSITNTPFGITNLAAANQGVAFTSNQVSFSYGGADTLKISNNVVSINGSMTVDTFNATTLNAGTVIGEGSGLTNSVGATNIYQFVTLEQLQDAIVSSEVYYLRGASNAAAIGLSGTVLSTNWAYSTLGTAYTNTITGYAAGNYLMAFLTADTFTEAASGLVDVDIWCYENNAGSATITAELYAYNDVTGAEEYEFEPAPAAQTVPSGAAPGLLSFSVSVPDYSSTTNLRALVKIKVISTSLSPDVRIVSGGAYNTHMSFSQPGSAYVKKTGDTMSGTLNLPALKVSTNSWAGATNTLPMSLSWQRYTAWTPCSITGITGKGATGTYVDSTLLTITNASTTNITLYLAAGIRTGDGLGEYTISNATIGKLSVEYAPSPETNAVFRLFYR